MGGGGLRGGQLTLDRTEAPALVRSVVVGGGAPQVAVLAADGGALVEPLAVVQEGQVAGPAVGVALDGVDLWGGAAGEGNVTAGSPCACGRRFSCDPSGPPGALCVRLLSACVFSASRTSKHTVKTEDDVTVEAAGRQRGESTPRINTLICFCPGQGSEKGFKKRCSGLQSWTESTPIQNLAES